MDIMFTFVPIASMLIFGLAFGLIIASLVRSGRQWNRDNHSPRLTVDAGIVAKRTDVRRMAGTDNLHSHRTHTTYYVTFQVESGDRMELQVQGHEYGLLVEGDQGRLTFQGSRFLSFERT